MGERIISKLGPLGVVEILVCFAAGILFFGAGRVLLGFGDFLFAEYSHCAQVGLLFVGVNFACWAYPGS